MAKKPTTYERKKGGVIYSKRKIRSIIAERADEILKVLFEALHNEKNYNVQLGAAKILINKILPDLKATELSTPKNQSLDGLIKIIYENNTTVPMADHS
jgi:hypothetical protein